MKYYCHKTSEVQTENIGEGTIVWQFVVILKNAIIGTNCNINAHVFIENEVVIGNNVTVKSGVQLWDGLTIENNVFIGPNVTFTNDLTPRSKQIPDKFERTTLKEGTSIGANATIVGGIVLDEFSMIGAGSVVTKSVGKHELWYGNPAKHRGYVTQKGIKLDMNLQDTLSGKIYYWEDKLLKEKND